MRVVVVGAGAAGLAATHLLKKNGIDVMVLESKGVAGGRARSFEKDGFTFDTGAQFSEKQWPLTRNIAEDMGMGSDLIPFTFKIAIWRNGKPHPVYATANIIEQLKSLPETMMFRGIPLTAYPQVARFGLSVLPRVLGLKPGDLACEQLIDLGDTSAADFALQHGGEKVLDYLVCTMLGLLTLGEPEEITICHMIALMGAAHGIRIFKHGMGSLTAALYERYKDSIRLSTPVEEIVVDNKKVKGVKTKDGIIEADHVICATTAGVARKILPDLPDTIRKPLETVKYSSTTHFLFALEKKLLGEKWLGFVIPRSAGSFLPGIGDSGCKSPYFAPEGAELLQTFTYGRHDAELSKLPVEELKTKVIKEVQKYLPGMPDEPYLTEYARWDEAICLQPPGQFPAIVCLKKNHLKDVRGLYLAGSYMYLISCMEGAMTSGYDAARAILESGN
ncbi:MAG: FAD-dependent oxidoreductase [Actinobacteria bacterium]|nr:FAD-dependent oxidoreductase [Actinomycetota bacterium]